MLENLFRAVLTMSAGASVVILAVLGLRLLCPVFPESGISLMPGDADVETALEAVIASDDRSVQTMESVASLDKSVFENQSAVQEPLPTVVTTPGQQSSVDVEHQPSVQQPEQQSKPENIPSGWQIGTAVWLAGIWVMAMYGVWSLFRLKSRLVPSVDLGNGVHLADHIDTPFVMGLFRPRIYLPSYLKPEKAEYIVLHEKYHISRFDHVLKLVYFAALCLHWFNPLVWLAFILMGYDMEMSCDEAVMEKLNQDLRKDYAASLLQLSTGRRKIAPTPLAFGEGDPKGRIKNVLNYRKPHVWIVLAAVVVCVAAAVCLLTNPVETDKELLNYPGLQWGMTIEEVQSALGFSNDAIVKVEDRGNVMGYYVEGLNYFGLPVEQILLNFTSSYGNPYGLYEVIVLLPDDTDMEKAKQTMTAYYGDPIDSYTYMADWTYGKETTEESEEGNDLWLSQATIGNTFSEGELELMLQFYEDRDWFNREFFVEGLYTTPLARINLTDDLYHKVLHADLYNTETIKAVRYHSKMFNTEQILARLADENG